MSKEMLSFTYEERFFANRVSKMISPSKNKTNEMLIVAVTLELIKVAVEIARLCFILNTLYIELLTAQRGHPAAPVLRYYDFDYQDRRGKNNCLPHPVYQNYSKDYLPQR
jgi:hypothetical protein